MSGDTDGYGSRKFIITVGVVALSFVLCLAGKMSGAEASAIFVTALAAYNWANMRVHQAEEHTMQERLE